MLYTMPRVARTPTEQRSPRPEFNGSNFKCVCCDFYCDRQVHLHDVEE